MPGYQITALAGHRTVPAQHIAEALRRHPPQPGSWPQWTPPSPDFCLLRKGNKLPVCMNLASNYRALVRKHFPNALLVAGRFHAIRLINHHFLNCWRELDTAESKNRFLLSLMRRHRYHLATGWAGATGSTRPHPALLVPGDRGHVEIHSQPWNHRGLPHQNGGPPASGLRLPQLPKLSSAS